MLRASSSGSGRSESWDSDLDRESASGADQVRTSDGADGRRNKNDADRPAASRRSSQICSGIARLQVGGHAGPVDQHRTKEQNDVADTGCDNDSDAA
jgi:hypothetical protein